MLESDLNDSLHDFSEYNNYLFQTIDRNGKTFKFDTEKAGKWDVWCEYFNSTSGKTLKSENAQVETGTQKDMTFVVYIVLGLGAAAVIGVTIGAAVRSKKEKIW